MDFDVQEFLNKKGAGEIRESLRKVWKRKCLFSLWTTITIQKSCVQYVVESWRKHKHDTKLFFRWFLYIFSRDVFSYIPKVHLTQLSPQHRLIPHSVWYNLLYSRKNIFQYPWVKRYSVYYLRYLVDEKHIQRSVLILSFYQNTTI